MMPEDGAFAEISAAIHILLRPQHLPFLEIKSSI
jgi:hypothetical protein